jgi:uncharacterized damage-inducible protein DinB
MYRAVKDFLEDWKNESGFTIQIFSKIPDAAMHHKPNQNIRSLGRLSWHITQTLTEMPHKAGIVEADDLDEKPIPGTMEEILDTYKKYSGQLLQSIKGKWTDDDLSQSVEMYGQKWTNGSILSSLVRHQIHHRAQMTILMRLQNIAVPGIYGPAQEEWAGFGMNPPE